MTLNICHLSPKKVLLLSEINRENMIARLTLIPIKRIIMLQLKVPCFASKLQKTLFMKVHW